MLGAISSRVDEAPRLHCCCGRRRGRWMWVVGEQRVAHCRAGKAVAGRPAAGLRPADIVRRQPRNALPAAASQNTRVGGDQNGPPPVALAGTTAFVTTGTSTVVVDTTSGHVIGHIAAVHSVPKPPGQDQAFAGGAAPPALIEPLQGRQTALVGYVAEIPGHGTTPPALALEVDALDTSAHRLWTLTTALPGQPSDLTSTPGPAFVGAFGKTIVVAEGDSEDGYLSEAIDLGTRRRIWQNRSFLADATVGGAVIGTIDTSSPSSQGANATLIGTGVHLASLDIRTGRTVWQQRQTVTDAQVQSGGPRALFEARDYSGNDVIELLDPNTGKADVLFKRTGQVGGPPWTCTFDGRSAYVCSDTIGAGQAFALDASTGETLWQLPDKAQNRIAPKVTTAWHGAVFGTTRSGPVVLDARSGRDLNDTPGIAPILVDPYVGVADSGNGLEAYPATRGLASGASS
jgi:outer membrane protein assembly factor BamB